MKRFTSALFALGLIAAVSPAALAADLDVPADTYADMGWYLRADGGWSWLDTDNGDDGAFALGGGMGYQYSDNLRGDIRGDWAGLDGDDYLTTLTGNLYFDIPMDTVITPYIGAGAGYGWASGNSDGVAIALMAGAELGLSDNLSADLGYRYRAILSEDANDHQLLVGLRYKF